MRLVAAGVSYRATPLRTREAAAAAVADSTALLRYLVGHAGISGAACLSTCNRTDFYLACPDEVASQAAPRLARYLDPSGRADLSRHLRAVYDRDAVLHLFRVAAGLESMVVGEAQVLGQLKQAHRQARHAGTLDSRLDHVLRRAVSAAKRVRTETSLARGAGSLSDAAVGAAERALGSLRGRGVLLIGAGTVSTLAARRLAARGSSVLVTSRSETAAALAARCGGRAVAFDQLVEEADRIDAVVCSTSSPTAVLDAATVSAMQQRRGDRPLCIVDMAVPRDVEPRAATIPGVTLIDIDELGERLALSALRRQHAVVEAERILDEEAERTMQLVAARDTVTPTISALLRRADQVRSAELERTLARMPELGAAERRRVEAMSRSMVRKLLHPPVSRLREAAGDPAVVLTIREAFDLDG